MQINKFDAKEDFRANFRDQINNWETFPLSLIKLPKNLVDDSQTLRLKITFPTSTIEIAIAKIPNPSTPKCLAKINIVRAEQRPAKTFPSPKILKLLIILLYISLIVIQ